MKKTSAKSSKTSEMRTEYDFTEGVRGKHTKALQAGYTIRVYKTDGTMVEKRVTGKDMVTLAPDVRKYFPTSQAVNHALRTLIELVPGKSKAAQKGRGKSIRKPPARNRSR